MPASRSALREPNLRREGLSLVPLAVEPLDLAAPPACLLLGSGYRGAYLLLHRDGIPLDTLVVPAPQGRIPYEVLAAAVRRKLHGRAPKLGRPRLPSAPPSVSVVVCTRDRPDDLARCLEALRHLDYPSLELLVVDNAPSDTLTRRLVGRRFPQVRYVVEPEPGLNRARNRAITEARGEIIAFTDDDVIVAPGWVRGIVAAFCEHPDAACVTGLTLPAELETPAQVIFEVNGSFSRGFEQRRFEKRRGWRQRYAHLIGGVFGAGANMAFRRTVFDLVGPFDPFLDVGTPTNGGGDIEMFFRIVEEGYPLVYDPRAVVWHRHRRTLDDLARQFAGWGAFYAFLTRTALHYPHLRAPAIRRGLWWFVRRHVLRWAAHPFRRTIVPPAVMWAELRGCLDGLSSYWRSRSASRTPGAVTPARGPVAEAHTSC